MELNARARRLANSIRTAIVDTAQTLHVEVDTRGRLRVYTNSMCEKPGIDGFWMDEVVLPALSLWARARRNRTVRVLVQLVTGAAQALILAFLLSGGPGRGSTGIVVLLGVLLGVAALLEGLLSVMEDRDREKLSSVIPRLHRSALESSIAYRHAYTVTAYTVEALVEAYCRRSPLLVYGPVVVALEGGEGRFQVIKPRV